MSNSLKRMENNEIFLAESNLNIFTIIRVSEKIILWIISLSIIIAVLAVFLLSSRLDRENPEFYFYSLPLSSEYEFMNDLYGDGNIISQKNNLSLFFYFFNNDSFLKKNFSKFYNPNSNFESSDDKDLNEIIDQRVNTIKLMKMTNENAENEGSFAYRVMIPDLDIQSASLIISGTLEDINKKIQKHYSNFFIQALEVEKLAKEVKSYSIINQMETISLKYYADLEIEIKSLEESAKIARELGIERDTDLFNNDRANLFIQSSTENKFMEYTRGYAALEKEIELIKKRNPSSIKKYSEEYSNLSIQLDSINKNTKIFKIEKVLELINGLNNTEFIAFNDFNTDEKQSYLLLILLTLFLSFLIFIICIFINFFIFAYKKNTEDL